MSQFVWTFPGGRTLVDVVTATAGNIVDTYTVPSGKKNQILVTKVVLVTDATVVNRYIQVEITDGTTSLFLILSDAVTASITRTKYYIIGLATAGAVYNALPNNNMLEAGYEVKITITGGVAGDSYTATHWYREIDAP